MAGPTYSQVHAVDPLLTNMMIGWTPPEDVYIARAFVPSVPVKEKTAKYYIHNQGDTLRDSAKPRAPGQAPASGGFRLSTDSYVCEEKSYRHKMPDEIRAQYQAADGADRAAINHVGTKIRIAEERACASAFFTTGIWTGSSTATDLVGGTDFTRWSDSASTPVKDIRDQLYYVWRSNGFRPTTGVLGAAVAEALMQHADFRGRLSDNEVKEVDLAFIARILGLKKVVVGLAVYNSANEGATDVITPVFDQNDALFIYVPEQVSIDKPAAAMHYSWTAFDGVAGDGTVGVKQYRAADEGEASDWYQANVYDDFKVTGAALGVYFDGATNVS